MPCDGCNLVGGLPYAEQPPAYAKPQGAEVMIFDLYFASIRSMQFHPGAGTRGHQRLSAQECAEAAMEMLEVRRTVLRG